MIGSFGVGVTNNGSKAKSAYPAGTSQPSTSRVLPKKSDQRRWQEALDAVEIPWAQPVTTDASRSRTPMPWTSTPVPSGWVCTRVVNPTAQEADPVETPTDIAPSPATRVCCTTTVSAAPPAPTTPVTPPRTSIRSTEPLPRNSAPVPLVAWGSSPTSVAVAPSTSVIAAALAQPWASMIVLARPAPVRVTPAGTAR